MATQKVFVFQQEGVIVTLPDEVDNVGVRSTRPPSLSEMPGIQGVFEPTRLVISIEFYPLDDESKYLSSINGRAKIQVRYTPEDVSSAGGSRDNLKLGFYWDGAWRLFTPEKHDFQIEPDESDPDYGEGIAFLQDWNDPPIAWDH